jgi:hypothetical protein
MFDLRPPENTRTRTEENKKEINVGEYPCRSTYIIDPPPSKNK